VKILIPKRHYIYNYRPNQKKYKQNPELQAFSLNLAETKQIELHHAG